MENQRIVLSSRPVGVPNWSNFELRKESISKTSIGENGVLVRSQLLSIDPAMRMWMSDAKSYMPPVGINEVMRAIGLGEVVASNNPAFKEVSCFSNTVTHLLHHIFADVRVSS